MIQEVQKAYQEIRKVRQEAQAKERLGLLSSIELGRKLPFGKEGLRLSHYMQQIHRHASVARNGSAHHNPRRTQVRQRFRRAA